MKGSTTISEVMNLPNTMIHTLWKLYVDTMRNKEAADGVATEQAMDELQDTMEE